MRMTMLASVGLLSWSPAKHSPASGNALVSRKSTLRLGSRACIAMPHVVDYSSFNMLSGSAQSGVCVIQF